MLWAHKKGNVEVVSANEAISTNQYSCPNCGAPVILRAKSEYSRKQPYFAHQMRTANPECENYHPSNYRYRHSYASADRTNKERVLIGSRNLTLRFCNDESIGPSLEILLPKADESIVWEGRIWIAGIHGERCLTYKGLASSSMRIRVRPQSEPYTFWKEGLVDPIYWSAIADGIEGLRRNQLNFFVQSPFGGRQIRPNEPLHWNESYSILCVRPGIKPPDWEVHGLECKNINWINDWLITEITLPSDEELSENLKVAISEWLGKTINIPYPTLLLRYPYPIGISEEGNLLVRPNNSYKLILSKTSHLEIESEEGGYIGLGSCSQGEHTVGPLSRGLHTIYLDGEPSLGLLIEDQDPFEPSGILVRSAASKTELFASQYLFEQLREDLLDSSDFEIIIPDEKLKLIIKINGQKYENVQQLIDRARDKSRNFYLEAGNYGSIFLRENKTYVGKVASLTPRSRMQIDWLSTLPLPIPGQPSTSLPLQYINVSILKKLRSRRWPARFTPNIVSLIARLKKEGLLDGVE